MKNTLIYLADAHQVTSSVQKIKSPQVGKTKQAKGYKAKQRKLYIGQVLYALLKRGTAQNR